MLYIDTSVLLVYTLTQAVEKDRFPATESFFSKIAVGSLLGATSFYALQEVHIFAIENAPDFLTGAAFGKAALEQILALPLVIVPFVSRVERKVHAHKLTALRDSTDVPHAIAALVYGCELPPAALLVTGAPPPGYLLPLRSRWVVPRREA